MSQPHSHCRAKADCNCKKESGQAAQSKEDRIIVNTYKPLVSNTEAKPSAKTRPKKYPVNSERLLMVK